MEYTNANGARLFGKYWHNLTWGEFLRFHAVLFRMGLTIRPNLKSYFGDAGVECVKSVGMSGRRFRRIYREAQKNGTDSHHQIDNFVGWAALGSTNVEDFIFCENLFLL